MVKMRNRSAAAVQTNDTTRASHPMLGIGSVYLMIYSWIKKNPGCTRGEVSKQLRVNQQRISDLIHNGLVRVEGKAGRFARLYPVVENEIGVGRDKVRVMVTILVNEYGEYSCEARIEGEAPGARQGVRTSVMDKNFTVMIPKPQEGYIPRQTFTPDNMATNTRRIVDAEYEMVVEPD